MVIINLTHFNGMLRYISESFIRLADYVCFSIIIISACIFNRFGFNSFRLKWILIIFDLSARAARGICDFFTDLFLKNILNF